ncbi:MAG: NAD(P)H-dependent glycerol-3-phosphate dehydrogenase, partial [Acidimicrobiia bacterium]|nr:NAD(P)H-dependent glycerol-3-phosphate dehydrogenase [Acidimicrobiia bacterium]
MTINVTVLGAGSWGTTVAHLAAHNTPTVLWGRHSDVVEEINVDHRNSRYLADRDLHP